MSVAVTPPPHSTEAEQSVLGALLIDADAIFKIDGRLRADDFYDPAHASIYRAVQELVQEGSPIDLLTVSTKLDGVKDVNGGSAYLAELTTVVPTASNIEHYADIVLGFSRRRQLAAVGKKMASIAATEEKTADELFEQAEQEFLRLSQHTASLGPVRLSDMRDARYEHYQSLDDPATQYGVQTGYKDLDAKLTVLAPGQFIVLAARPSMGKTALALNIARNVGMTQQKTVGIFSLEMTSGEVFDRVLGDVADIAPWRLTKGRFREKDFARIGEGMDRIGESRIYVDDDPNRTLTNIRSKARRLQVENGLDLLIIDYLQLIRVTDRFARENRTREMSHVSENIKELARELQCPILALSQLNRDCDRRPDKQPQLSDLRDSGSLEQDADRVLMLYRESYYEEDAESNVDIFIRKNRNGPTGRIELAFDPELMRFAPFDPKRPVLERVR